MSFGYTVLGFGSGQGIIGVLPVTTNYLVVAGGGGGGTRYSSSANEDGGGGGAGCGNGGAGGAGGSGLGILVEPAVSIPKSAPGVWSMQSLYSNVRAGTWTN